VRRQARQLDERRRADRLEERRAERALAPRHRRQEDDGGPFGDRRVEPLQRAHVLIVYVDVDEGGEAVAALEHLPSERGEALGEVGEEVAERWARGLDLPGAADGVTKRGRDPDSSHDAT
jgi:hypothetical protein